MPEPLSITALAEIKVHPIVSVDEPISSKDAQQLHTAEDLSGVRLPVKHLQSHFLNQVSDAAYYHRDNRQQLSTSSAAAAAPQPRRARLHVCISFTDMKTIDLVNETFSCKLRIYAMWEEDLSKAAGLTHVMERARQSEEYTSLSASEIEEFEKHWGAPLDKLNVFNAVACECDEQSLRLYSSGTPGRTALMWNREYRVECRERFELQNFPFDSQSLQIELRLNDPKTWDRFDLQVIAVQFHREALKLTEWAVLRPTVCRESPATRCTCITMRVTRLTHYYVVNVIGIMSGLTILGMLTYTMPIDDVGNRINMLLTLILTSVAFKFVLAGALPKVPYNTLLDYFVLLSMVTLAVTAFLSVVPLYLPMVYSGTDGEFVNYICAADSGGFVFFTLGGWIIRAYFVIWSRIDTKLVKPVAGVNWYAFQFYELPYFLK